MRTFVQLPHELGPVTAVDLGCGRGQQVLQFQEAGYTHVVGVDRRINPARRFGKRIEWVEDDVPTWIQKVGDTRAFTVVFCRNFIQHLPPEVVRSIVLPGLKRLCAPGGYVTLMTFERPPNPVFSHPWESLWTLDDLRGMFSGWKEVSAYSGTYQGPDMRGQTRRWHPTRILVRKPY